MSFNKDMLKKIANEIRESGISYKKSKELIKMASDLRIAYITAYIKNIK